MNEEAAMTPEELLALEPAGELDELLARDTRAPRTRPTATHALLAGLLVVGGFYAGVLVEGRAAGPGRGAPMMTFNDGAGGMRGSGRPQAQVEPPTAAASAQSIEGRVRLVDDGIVYVETDDGIVRVATDETTEVSAEQPAEVSQLRPGDEVRVEGEADDDGSVRASRLQRRAEGAT